MRTNRSSRSCCDQFGEIGAILVPARGTPAFRPLIPGATSSRQKFREMAEMTHIRVKGFGTRHAQEDPSEDEKSATSA